MLNLSSQQKLLLAVTPVDFRFEITGLSALCKAKLDADPFSGMVFIFSNRSRTAVKLLMYDSNGFWLASKKFSQGKLSWWPTDKKPLLQIQAAALQVLLSQGDPRFMYTPAPWRKHDSDATQEFQAT